MEFKSEVITIDGDNGTSFEFKEDINPSEVEYTIHDSQIVKLEGNTFYGLKLLFPSY